MVKWNLVGVIIMVKSFFLHDVYTEDGELWSRKEFKNGRLLSQTLYRDGQIISEKIY